MSFNTDRELDIIVYGATSYVGKLVCEHLKNNYLNKYDVTSKESIKIGMGGRSKEKLEKVKDELGLPIDLPIFVVDSFDVNGLENMCKVTKAVITLVGPYAKFGDGLIKACAEKGTHYFDLTGETLWVSNQITNLNIKSKLSKSMQQVPKGTTAPAQFHEKGTGTH